MGEKILTEKMIDEKLAQVRPQEIKYFDPMKLAFWSLETAAHMADDTIGKDKIAKAIKLKELKGYKIGKEIGVVPADFILWYKRAIHCG